MTDEIKAIQMIAVDEVKFESPHPDIHVARIPIANASWVKTTDGIVVIDTLLNSFTGKTMKAHVDQTGGPVKYIIYTHHHNDHVGGARAFLGDHPEVIAHRYTAEGLEKYTILREHRARIAAIQFNLPFTPERIPNYVYPTRTYDTSMAFTLGDKTFELYHARAETDDATWVYVPELKTAFVGDLIIAGFPNVGNPFKPTRFALSWARALEAVREKSPEILIAHGGRAIYMGENVTELLDVTIEGIHAIHDQVVDCINRDMPVDEMIHAVKLPAHLKDHKWLQHIYSRPEFAVYNIYRWYHGYFDHNPAHLLPRPEKEVNTELFNLIGDGGRILSRSRELHQKGLSQLALQVLDVLLQKEPDNVDARTLRLDILKKLGSEDYCLMSKNTWVYFMQKDKDFLGLK